MLTLWPISHSSVEQSESMREPGPILYAYISKPALTWRVTRHSFHLLPSAMQSSDVHKRLHYFVRACLNKDAESVCVAMLHLCPDSQTSSRASQMDLLNWILCLVSLHRQLCARCKLTPVSTGVSETRETASLCDGDTHCAWHCDDSQCRINIDIMCANTLCWQQKLLLFSFYNLLILTVTLIRAYRDKSAKIIDTDNPQH